MKGNTAVYAILIIAAIAILGGFVQFSSSGVKFSSVPSVSQPAAVAPVASTGGFCPSTGLTTMYARVTNPLNSSGQYVAAKLYVVDAVTGKVFTSSSGTQDGNYASLSANLPCGGTYKVIAIGNTSVQAATGSRTVYVESSGVPTGTTQSNGANVYVDMAVPLASALEFKVTDNNYNNMYGTSTAWQINNATANKTLWTQGTDGTWYITATVANSSAQYGSNAKVLGGVICASFATTFYNKDTMTLTGGGATPIALPTYCADQGYNKAWSISPITGQTVFTFYVKADKAAPTGATGTSPILYVFDNAGFLKADATLGVDIADQNDGLVGQTDNYVQIGISPAAA